MKPLSQRTPHERQQLLDKVRSWLDVPLAILAVVWVLAIVAGLGGLVPPELTPVVQNLVAIIWVIFLAELLESCG